MFDVLMFALNAVLPIVLLILFGYFLKRINFVSDAFLAGANKVVFRVALPVTLFLNVYNVDNLSDVNWNVVFFAVAAILTIFVLGLGSILIFTKDNRQKGVVLQTIVRSNFAIIGIPLITLLATNEIAAKSVASIIMLFIIPLTNVLSIIALTIFPKGEDQNQKINWGYTFAKIVKNPLIIGIGLGMIIVVIRPFFGGFTIEHDIRFLYTTAGFVSNLTTPLALIALGGTFKFSAVKKLAGQIIHGTLWRVILAPTLALTTAVLLKDRLGFDANVFPAFIALFASPVAVTSVVMAAEMDNDETLAAQLVVWNSIASIITIFVIIVILKSISLL